MVRRLIFKGSSVHTAVLMAAALLVGTLAFSVDTATSASPASAASGCGSKDTTDTWGFSVFGKWFTTHEHRAKSYSCKNSTVITTNRVDRHDCDKKSLVFTILWTKRKNADIDPAGTSEVWNTYECYMKLGGSVKGVGLEAERALFIRHKPYVRRASDTVPWVRTSIWDTCC